MKVSREELLHIANLASLNLKEDEVDTYLLHLQDILSYANIVSKAPTEGLSEAVGVSSTKMKSPSKIPALIILSPFTLSINVCLLFTNSGIIGK